MLRVAMVCKRSTDWRNQKEVHFKKFCIFDERVIAGTSRDHAMTRSGT